MNKLIFLILSISFTCQSQSLETVDHVDLKKYAGTWFEIASFPQRFQKGCYGTTATYSATNHNYLIVENRCFKDSLKGKESYIKGKAFVEEETGNSKLKVQFFWPFKGKYWIIDLAEDYSYAVVGHPNREYLWILSRAPEMHADLYENIVSRITEKGFDPNKLKKTVQIESK